MDTVTEAEKQTRGKGRGSSFSVLGREVWDRLWAAKTANRLNFVSAYLVLLVGSGADHRLTKWSAKACEDHIGMGKPRAKVAIEELIAAGLVERSSEATKLRPQYVLPHTPEEDEEPIFLPNQLITGLAGETPMVRRVRETGDALLLRMLIDLYGLIQLDATFGVPLSAFYKYSKVPPRKVTEVGANAVWALANEWVTEGCGDWAVVHRINADSNGESWRPFWDRVELLQKIGALVFEPWVFDGEGQDAEPMFPINPSVLYTPNYLPDDEAKLTSLAMETASLLLIGRSYLLDRYDGRLLVPVPLHHRAPALQGVAKLRVEADTPGRRMAFAQRKKRIKQYTQGLERLKSSFENGETDVPFRLYFGEEAA